MPSLAAKARAKAAGWPATYEPFDNFETPVAPAVAQAHQLQWWTPDRRYLFWGKTVTMDEYLGLYLEDRRRRTALANA